MQKRAAAGAAAAAVAVAALVAISASAPAEYDPQREREPVSSGPFEIDSSEYALGENIFFTAGRTDPSVSGTIKFMRPSDSGHLPYKIVEFEGENTPFNQYFTPVASKRAGICSGAELAGEWLVTFEGTPYPPIRFSINGDTVVPGQEHRFEPVC